MAIILWFFNRGWVGALVQVGTSNEQLQAQTETLEETTKLLRATATVAHACSSILDPETLAVEVVNQIRKEFDPMGIYFVGLFMLRESEDETARSVVTLKAATGAIGQQLLDRKHAQPLDGASPISLCITRRRPVVVSGEDRKETPKELLENTYSEAALPLRSRGRILGALSVHSARKGAFAEGMIAVLETMADQVATALDNARLFTQTGTALREVQAAQRRYLAEAWKEFLTLRPASHIDYVQPGVKMDRGDDKLLKDARLAAILHQRAVATDFAKPDADEPTQTVLVVPLKLRGQVIGTLSLHETRRRRPWTAAQIAMAETIAEQVALTIENLRLMDEAQRRAAREQLISEIGGQLRASLDPDTILMTTVRELGSVLGAEMVSVELTAAPQDDGGAVEEEE
jgi:GAF domain-containing protein